MQRKEHHVVPRGNQGWAVEKAGSSRASILARTKTEAVALGREISRNQKTELIIHNADGRIANADSHGNDPCPPRDRK